MEGLSEEIRSIVESAITKAYDEIWEGEVKTFNNLPVESVTPLLMLKQLSSFARNFVINMDCFEYGFDPEMIFERIRKPSAKKQSMLKEIDTKFSKPNVGEDLKGIQIILDENAINSYLLEFVMID